MPSTDVAELAAGMRSATGRIVFDDQPADGDVLVIYGTTFEFLDDLEDATAGYVPVQIGDAAADTRNNFLAALERWKTGQVKLVSVTAITVEGAPALDLASIRGTAGNATITTDCSDLTVSGMSGGEDAGLVKVKVLNPEELAMPVVPTPDSTGNAYSHEVLGNKADAAVTTVGVVASIVAYVKGCLNQLVALLAAIGDAAGTSVIQRLAAISAALTAQAAAPGNWRIAVKSAPVGAEGAVELFAISGPVEVSVIGLNTVPITIGEGDEPYISVGDTNVIEIYLQQVPPTDFENGPVWAQPPSSPQLIGEYGTFQAPKVVAGVNGSFSSRIVQHITGDDCTGGEITYYARWRPLADGASVTPVVTP